jgi:imidazoleglycerol-phosphate dehydratase
MTGTITISNVEAIDLSKSSLPINTGIGFFDHMLDQLNSHAQIGVAVVVNGSGDLNDSNRHADETLQKELMSQVGTALGNEIKKLVPSCATQSRFCCPLDEGLVECILTSSGSTTHGEPGSESDSKSQCLSFDLAPYGIFPKTGRTKIGNMMTAPLQYFFESLAVASGLNISLQKIRGDNGHHIVESAFKAFSRALRNLIDGTNTDVDTSIDTGIDTDTGINTNTALSEGSSGNMEHMWGSESQSAKESLDLKRCGESSRTTKETTINVAVALDGGAKGSKIETGIKTLDSFYAHMAKESGLSLNVLCRGDTWVDDHHTSEDVSIAIGKVLNIALGTKAGLNRMWCAKAQQGDAVVEVTMDLSNRPCLTSNLSLSQCEYVGDMSVEMLDHAIDSLVMNGQMTVHIVECSSGDILDLAMATAKAFGRALKLCSAVDPRRAGKTASSKGTLSA